MDKCNICGVETGKQKLNEALDAIEELEKSLSVKNKQLEAANQRELELLAVIKDMRFSILLLTVSSCTCCTKTNVAAFHKENCQYRILQEALERSYVPSQALREHEAKVLEDVIRDGRLSESENAYLQRRADRLRMAEERRKK